MRCEALLAAVLVTAAACDDGSGGQDATFEAVVEQVLEKKCTFGQCHSSTTAAAKLDLTPRFACKALVNRPSCLFPERLRVVPGNPDASFFFHKLSGEGLAATPTSDCGSGSATRTNFLMPFGAAALSGAELELVRGWIADGAMCDGEDSDPKSQGPAIATIIATTTAPLAGETVSFTVTLDRAAPEGGQMLELTTDQTMLSAPTQHLIPAGSTSIRFDGFAGRPTSRFTLRARTGESSKELVLRVTGLEIAEVLADPQGDDDGLQWIKLRNRSSVELNLSEYRLQAGQANYDVMSVDLTGTLPPGGCAVIGGPIQSGSNSDPVYSQVENFTPDLPHAGTQAAGFAVFDNHATPLGGLLTPVDALLVGVENHTQLLDPDAEIATPHCGTPLTGTSALRTSAVTCIQSQMQPAACD